MWLNLRNADHYEALRELMVQESLVSSTDEAIAVIESIIEEIPERDDRTIQCDITDLLGDYFDVSIEDSTLLVSRYFPFLQHVEAPFEEDADVLYPNDSENSDNDVDEVIGPGDCELCERDDIRLTRHHLIPKCTWRRIEPMILALWIDSMEVQKNNDEFTPFHHLLPTMDALAACVPACQTARGRQAASGKRIIRDVLSYQTIDICRSCHDHIHKTHDNRTLSLQFNTLDKLLDDPCIAKYAQWASHQGSKHSACAGVLRISRNRHRFKK